MMIIIKYRFVCVFRDIHAQSMDAMRLLLSTMTKVGPKLPLQRPQHEELFKFSIFRRRDSFIVTFS